MQDIKSGHEISFKKFEDLADFKMLKHPQCTPTFDSTSNKLLTTHSPSQLGYKPQ